VSTLPNVILCLCDQLRPFEVGCYGNAVIRTPHLDRLARSGMRFELAVTNDPVCMPARSSLLTGQYARTCMGALGNAAEPSPGGQVTMPEYPVRERRMLPDPTLPEQLRRQGYETALIGKWHIHPAPDLVGFDESVYPRVHHRHTGQSFSETDGTEHPVEGFSVEYEAQRVAEFLARRRDHPFFLFYSISPPHMPLRDAPERVLTMYSPDEVPLRPNTRVNGALAHDERWFRIYLYDFLYYDRQLPHTTAPLPAGFDLRHLTALYYGATTWVDDMLGRLLAGLEANGLADNTIVVFASDHGDNSGSHHRFNKDLLIEESIRIPLLFAGPGIRPGAVNSRHVAQIVDLMPSLLDLCGGETPHTVQGRSLAPILRGEAERLPDDAGFIETSGGLIGLRTPTHLYGIRLATDLWTPAEDPYCFHDLRDDPYELHNLAGAGRQADLAEWLRGRLLAWHIGVPWHAAGIAPG